MEYLVVLIATPIMFTISLLFRHKLYLPLLCSIPPFIGYLIGLQTSIFSAFGAVILWTLLQSVLVIVTSRREPDSMKIRIHKSENYTHSMFRWIKTGSLPEGTTSEVIRSHFQQSIVYCVLALFTANFGSILLGCVLLNYMNFYVSQLAAQSKNAWKAVLLGWNFWSLVRVLAFLWIGVVLGMPLASYIVEVSEPFQLNWLIAGASGVILDLVLKLTFSNWWRKKLVLLLR